MVLLISLFVIIGVSFFCSCAYAARCWQTIELARLKSTPAPETESSPDEELTQALIDRIGKLETDLTALKTKISVQKAFNGKV